MPLKFLILIKSSKYSEEERISNKIYCYTINIVLLISDRIKFPINILAKLYDALLAYRRQLVVREPGQI